MLDATCLHIAAAPSHGKGRTTVLSSTLGTRRAPVSTLLPKGCRKPQNVLRPREQEAEVCGADVTPHS